MAKIWTKASRLVEYQIYQTNAFYKYYQYILAVSWFNIEYLNTESIENDKLS